MRNHVVVRDANGVPQFMASYTDQDIIVDERDGAFEIINLTLRSVESFPRFDADATVQVYETASSTEAEVSAWRAGTCLYEAAPNPYVIHADGTIENAHQNMCWFLSTVREEDLADITVVERGDGEEVWVSHAEDYLQFTPWRVVRALEAKLEAELV